MGFLDRGREIVENADARDVAAAETVLAEPGGFVSGSDELLAHGEVGLRFFDAFGPLYARYTAQPFDIEREIRTPYRRLAGIDFTSLRRDAEDFQAAGLDLAEQVAVLRVSFAGLASHWRGDAASEAADHVVGVLDLGGRLADDTAAVGRACGHLADALEETVRSYARATLELHSTTCATGSPAFVESLVEVATHRTGPALRDAARRILDEDFVPTFQERLRIFRDEIVTGYSDDVRMLWSEFHRATAVEHVPENPFRDVSPVAPGADSPPPVVGVPQARRDEPGPEAQPPVDVDGGTGPTAPPSGDEPASTQTASAGNTGGSGDAPTDGGTHQRGGGATLAGLTGGPVDGDGPGHASDDAGAALGHAAPAAPGGASLGAVPDRDRGAVPVASEVLQEAREWLRRALPQDQRDR